MKEIKKDKKKEWIKEIKKGRRKERRKEGRKKDRKKKKERKKDRKRYQGTVVVVVEREKEWVFDWFVFSDNEQIKNYDDINTECTK